MPFLNSKFGLLYFKKPNFISNALVNTLSESNIVSEEKYILDCALNFDASALKGFSNIKKEYLLTLTSS